MLSLLEYKSSIFRAVPCVFIRVLPPYRFAQLMHFVDDCSKRCLMLQEPYVYIRKVILIRYQSKVRTYVGKDSLKGTWVPNCCQSEWKCTGSPAAVREMSPRSSPVLLGEGRRPDTRDRRKSSLCSFWSSLSFAESWNRIAKQYVKFRVPFGLFQWQPF